MRTLILGILLGISLTAAAAWAWDHTANDRSANERGRIRRGLEDQQIQQDTDRILGRKPC